MSGRKHEPHGRRGEEVHSITSAQESHSDEMGAREIRYLLSMGVRTLCFVGGVLLFPYTHWVAGILFAGAIFLPYTSVILANAGVKTRTENPTFEKPSRGELGAGGPVTDKPAADKPAAETPGAGEPRE